MTAQERAEHNFDVYLRQNPYPGRGLVVGRPDADTWLILYWIMGRSASSRNRRLVAEGGLLRTEPVDPHLVTDPSLILYEAMLELPGLYLVSNGSQTRTLYEMLLEGGTFEEAVAQREREPDAPHYTPRICGLLDLRGGEDVVTLGILKANPVDPAYTDRYIYRPAMPQAGYGVGLTTYRGDGHPLPSFSGEPLLWPCQGRAEEVLQAYWEALNPEHRVAMAVKRISAADHSREVLISNRF